MFKRSSVRSARQQRPTSQLSFERLESRRVLAFDAFEAAEIAGDYDHNGAVDGSDFLSWQRQLGQSSGHADGNGNGVTDAEDLLFWSDGFGSPVTEVQKLWPYVDVNGVLEQVTPRGALTVSDTVIQYETDSNDTLLVLNADGILSRSGLGGSETELISESTTKFVVSQESSLYHLTEDGWLHVDGTPTYANTKDFFLTADGTLYWQGVAGELGRLRVGGAWEQLDYDLTRFTIASNGAAYSLGQDNWLNIDGVPAYGNTKDFFLGSDDSLYWQGVTGFFQRLPLGGAWELLDNDVESFSFNPSGAVYSLGRDGWLNIDGVPSYGNTKDFFLTDDGVLYWQGVTGFFQRLPLGGTWETLDTDLIKFSMLADGSVYSLGVDGWLNVNGVESYGNTKDFFFEGSADTLYWRSNADLFQRLLPSGVWETLDSDVTKWSFGADGSIYTLGRDGWINVNGIPSYGNTKDFALDDQQTLYWQSTSDLFERLQFNSAVWETLDNDVSTFTRLSDGTIYSLGADGWLNIDGVPSYANTKSFSVNDERVLYWQGTTGYFERLRPGHAWETFDTDLVRWTEAPNGSIYSLGQDGWLNIDGVPSYGNTQDYFVTGDMTLYWKGTTNLFQRLVAGVWETLDNDLKTFVFGPDGKVYSLGADHWLNIDGVPSYGATKSFTLSPDNVLYWQRIDGLFQRLVGGSWQTLDLDMVRFEIDPEGTVYSLGRDGWLNVNGSPSWGNTKDFFLNDEGTLYWQRLDGYFQRRVVGGTWETVEPSLNDEITVTLGSDRVLTIEGTNRGELIEITQWGDQLRVNGALLQWPAYSVSEVLIYGLSGDDTIRSLLSTISATISGGSDNDEIVGGSGADSLFGDDGADVIWGGLGDDYLNGGVGADRLYGGDGDDYFLELGATFDGTDADGAVITGADLNLIYGDSGDDTLRWGEGEDDTEGLDSFWENLGDLIEDIGEFYLSATILRVATTFGAPLGFVGMAGATYLGFNAVYGDEWDDKLKEHVKRLAIIAPVVLTAGGAAWPISALSAFASEGTVALIEERRFDFGSAVAGAVGSMITVIPGRFPADLSRAGKALFTAGISVGSQVQLALVFGREINPLSAALSGLSVFASTSIEQASSVTPLAERMIARAATSIAIDAAMSAIMGERFDPLTSIKREILNTGGSLLGMAIESRLPPPQQEQTTYEIDKEKLEAQLIVGEGLKLERYPDPKGIPTIGVGFNLQRADAPALLASVGADYDSIMAGGSITREQAIALMRVDMLRSIEECRDFFPNFDRLTEARQRVLADMMFNMGRGVAEGPNKRGFASFKDMIAAVNRPDFNEAANQMRNSKWFTDVQADRSGLLIYMMRSGASP
jgi:GH24 family phage-related lysozyme (muramidase)